MLEGRAPVRDFVPEVDAGDDAAVLPGGVVVTVDAMVEGVHWDPRLSAEDVGWKLVAVNASDLGAMGARPRWGLLALCLPRPLDGGWVDAFARGLHAALAEWGIHLVGGDVTRSPGPRMLSLTLGGEAAGPVTRGGARPGDRIWVSGTLGDAALGFLEGGAGLDWLRRPRPPVQLGVALAEAGLLTAMMDISDGLATDLGRLCRASGVGALVDPSALPASPEIGAHPRRLALQVGFGDDYQLLFTAPPLHDQAIEEQAQHLGIGLSPIGLIRAGDRVELKGQPWPEPLFRHFGQEGLQPEPGARR